MTQEEKQLLLIDLCARLLYGVKVQYLTEGDKTYICNVDQVSIKSQCVGIAETGHIVFTWRTIDRIKPYLRPLSSMTEEELNKLRNYTGLLYDTLQNGAYKCLDFYLSEVPADVVIKVFDWLNQHHFDYRGLIEQGLALEATKDMYKIK